MYVQVSMNLSARRFKKHGFLILPFSAITIHSLGVVTMQYHVFIILFQVLAMASPPNNINISDDLINLYRVINKHDTTDDPCTDIKLNNSHVFSKLECKINTILQRLSIYYRSMMKAKNWTVIEGDQEVSQSMIIMMMRKDYDKIVCSLVPRCLAFIHSFGNDDLWIKLLQLYEVHRQLCLDLPRQLSNKCIPMSQDTNFFFTCDADVWNKLLSDFPPNQPEMQLVENVLKEDKNFVIDTFDAINKIDKKNLVPGLQIKTFRMTTSIVSNQSGVAVEDFPTVIMKDYRKKLDGKIQEVNEKHAEKTGVSVEKNMSVSDVTATWIFDKILKYEANFRFTVINNILYNQKFKTKKRGKSNTLALITNKKLVNILNIETDDFCQFAPLVLAYLKESCNNDVQS